MLQTRLVTMVPMFWLCNFLNMTLILDPDQALDDGTYSAVIGRAWLAGGRINIKVYAEGKAGVTHLNLNPLGVYVSESTLI